MGKTASQRPRDFLVNADQFGRWEPTQWIDVPPNLKEQAQLGGAYFQHRMAYAVIRAIKMHANVTFHGFADQLGTTHSTLMRKLYGQTNASYADMIGWGMALGIDVIPIFESGEDLLP